MPLVHMKAFDVVITKGAEHSYTTDSEDHFLTKPVMLIPAVKKVGKCLVPLGVCREIGIEKINRHPESSLAANLVSPRAKVNGASL